MQFLKCERHRKLNSGLACLEDIDLKSFDLNHDLNRKKNQFMILLISDFLIADIYEFNTNSCFQASTSTKCCACLNYSLSKCSEATQTCLPEEVSF